MVLLQIDTTELFLHVSVYSYRLRPRPVSYQNLSGLLNPNSVLWLTGQRSGEDEIQEVKSNQVYTPHTEAHNSKCSQKRKCEKYHQT